ncbi:unnamed protein product, partial [Laminaria digitata]
LFIAAKGVTHHGFHVIASCQIAEPRSPREALCGDGRQHGDWVCHRPRAGEDGGQGDVGVQERRQGPAGGRQAPRGGAGKARRGGRGPARRAGERRRR